MTVTSELSDAQDLPQGTTADTVNPGREFVPTHVYGCPIQESRQKWGAIGKGTVSRETVPSLATNAVSSGSTG